MNSNQFHIVGINYKKTDAAIRGQFAVGNEQYAVLLEKAKDLGIKELFVLSTCNRTEIYGLAPATVLINLLCEQTAGEKDLFQQLCYIKQGDEAIQHIFSVGAGLDSQILGDYEIVGQMKLAVKFAKEKGCIGAFMERLFNTVLQSSKSIKNQTALSGGTVSVAFAAIQYLRENVQALNTKKTVVIGIGKIGRNTCKNLVDYIGADFTVMNRTDEKAEELAQELNVAFAPYDNLNEQVEKADIVIVATNSETPIIYKQQLLNSNAKVLIDLSIPNNIDPRTSELAHIDLVNVDDLSKINDATLQKRMAEVPKAKTIINEHIGDFNEWLQTRKHAPVLKAIKQKLNDMQHCELFLSSFSGTAYVVNKDAIQKTVTTTAVKMRSSNQPGCNFIEAINDFINVSIN
ncbi:MAG: glutamyl-tRNA reductase [Bacteroidota bacterium]|nr:glutamyl-tRNA reductase [Bacteroidota bacterium]